MISMQLMRVKKEHANLINDMSTQQKDSVREINEVVTEKIIIMSIIHVSWLLKRRIH